MFLKFDSNLCRVCMKENIQSNILQDERYVEMFKNCTQIEVTADDGLPRSLCDDCVKRLTIANEFRKQSLVSDQSLRHFMTSINSKFSEVAAAAKVDKIDLMDTNEGFLLNQNLDPPFADKEDSQPENDLQIQFVALPEVSTKEVSHDQFDDDDGDLAMESIKDDQSESFEDLIVIERSRPNKKRKSKLKAITQEEPTRNICIECNKEFGTKSNLIRHVFSHRGVKPFQCVTCLQTFTQNGSLKQHMLKHTGEKPHICNDCGKAFTRKRILIMHMRTHTGEKPHICDYCGLKFTVKSGLTRHVQTKHTQPSGSEFTCNVCNKSLSSKYSLQSHIKIHGNEMNEFECAICNFVCVTKKSLKVHLRTHDELKTVEFN